MIQVRVKGAKLRPIGEFSGFQGTLKRLSDDDKAKLKESIRRNGFNAPIFLWHGHDFILDGHQRIIAVQEMLESGDTIETGDQLPYVEVVADNERQAAEMVLTYNSQYGEMVDEGLKDFAKKFDLDVQSLTPMVKLGAALDALLFEDGQFKRPTFDNLVDKYKAKKECKENEAWLYVEYYADKPRYEEMLKLCRMKGNSQHELDPDWLYNLVKKAAKKC